MIHFVPNGGGPVSVNAREELCESGKGGDHACTHTDEDDRLVGERGEHETEGDDGAQVINEAGSEDALAELGLVRVPSRASPHKQRPWTSWAATPARQEARGERPPKKEAGNRRSSCKRCKEPHKSDHRYFLDLRSNDDPDLIGRPPGK